MYESKFQVMDSEEKKEADNGSGEKFPGYPHYPKSQDIYKKAREEGDVDPEQPDGLKPLENQGRRNEKDFEEDVSGSDLDVPGADQDDPQEEIGSEDEENNHYSLGGDNHDDQEAQKGT